MEVRKVNHTESLTEWRQRVWESWYGKKDHWRVVDMPIKILPKSNAVPQMEIPFYGDNTFMGLSVGELWLKANLTDEEFASYCTDRLQGDNKSEREST